MVILFLSELSSFLRVQREDRITIDTTRNEKMVINFNISLYEISCHGRMKADLNNVDASLDIMDISGQQQMGVMSRVVKIDLNEKGNPVNVATSSVLEEVRVMNDCNAKKNNDASCGNCFGAEVSNKCCNTCEDLLSAYRHRGWDTWFVEQYSPQCHGRNKDVLKDREPAKGCMLWGILEANKVAGNFHIAVGHAENRDSRHVHSFGKDQVFRFNTTHHIEK